MQTETVSAVVAMLQQASGRRRHSATACKRASVGEAVPVASSAQMKKDLRDLWADYAARQSRVLHTPAQMSNDLPSQRVIELLDAYFDCVVPAIAASGGEVLKLKSIWDVEEDIRVGP
jgi:class 3 adenylate cyclase